MASGGPRRSLTRVANPKTVLVVEDDSDLREAILDVLESAGLGVVMAGNGQEALDALRKRGEPSLILADLKMPVMDGFEFRRRMPEIPSFAAVPVVLLSGDSRAEQQARSLGFARLLKKPFGEGDLLRTVAQTCVN
jgi:CheY-like chemotaxis protein